ncbi:B3 domain-containing protein Os01g0723500-like [Tasmannia lanceolata]|uniref:B3 domain-containing protein Os01g0723500-like n=1 Tax=Tasmannia lanceolata TaxID=3420 RepID=UPI004062A6C8
MARPPRNRLERKKPHFFKVLLGDFSHHLRIPPAFIKHISKDATYKRTVILEDPSSRVWHVELSRKFNGTYLQDGWQEFAKAHSLRVSDFLVFRYDGNMRFSVLIFDKTACEKEDIFTSDSFQEPTFFHGPEKPGRPLKKSLDFGHVVSRQKACAIISKKHQSDSFQGKYKPSHIPDGVVRIQTEDLDPLVGVGGRVHYLRRRQHVMPEEKGKLHYLRRRHQVMSEEKEKVKERANSFTSNCPFFTKIMTSSHVRRGFFVEIPICFVRAHLRTERVKMILRVPKGNAWEVKLIILNKRRYGISGGWTAFARGNNLREGDSCIFELVGNLKMCVHIFRLSEEKRHRSNLKPSDGFWYA